jgi:hypothetical protein
MHFHIQLCISLLSYIKITYARETVKFQVKFIVFWDVVT